MGRSPSPGPGGVEVTSSRQSVSMISLRATSSPGIRDKASGKVFPGQCFILKENSSKGGVGISLIYPRLPS